MLHLLFLLSDMKKIFLIFTVFFTFFYCSSFVSGMGRFTLYPSYEHQGNKNWIIHKAQPGIEIHDFVTLENLSTENQKVTLLFREASADGENFSVNEYMHYENLGFWIKIPKSSYMLAPLEKMKIPVSLIIPKDTPLNTYHGVLYAAGSELHANTQILSRIGVRFYITVAEPDFLQNNIFNNPFHKNLFFFFISFAVMAGAIFYNVLSFPEKKKSVKNRI